MIDPRRTGTADRADEWIPIVPGTDAAFLLAMVHVLFADGLVELGDVGAHVDGVDAVRAAAADFPPERVAATCGISAETIRRVTRSTRPRRRRRCTAVSARATRSSGH